MDQLRLLVFATFRIRRKVQNGFGVKICPPIWIAMAVLRVEYGRLAFKTFGQIVGVEDDSNRPISSLSCCTTFRGTCK